ncbi:CD63 antigen-like [Nothobranchius furzeri]|uniref:CD63 antigen-like n=1 Tax=Nothobranchius furzeri TaxID=105023 RepID=UPI003904C38A
MCSICCIKCLFVFFNSLFLASGIVLITIGALQYSIYMQVGTFAGSGLSKVAIVLIAVGVTIALVSLLGHFGAFLDNSSMVACFICILIVIILLEILIGAFYVFRSRVSSLQMNSGINTKARMVINEYDPKHKHAIDRIQEKFLCCGADTYTDWSRSVGWRNPDAVPDSCCKQKKESCGQSKENVHTKGCTGAIKLFLLKNLVWVGGVCINLGVTEIFGILVGVCLCLDIKQRRYEDIYSSQ